MPPVFISVPINIREIIERIIVREGRYVDHPADPGGATNMGITFQTLSSWREKVVSKNDIKNLEKSEAIQIYYQKYWKPLKLHHLESHYWLKEFIFDWCVNGGLRNPVRQIQRLIGVRPDGIFGPITASTLITWTFWNGAQSCGKIVDLRIKWYIRLAVSKHSRIVFVEGWFNRANDLRYKAPPYTVTVV